MEKACELASNLTVEETSSLVCVNDIKFARVSSSSRVLPFSGTKAQWDITNDHSFKPKAGR